MIPTSFDESNFVLGRPPNMTDEQCAPLSVRFDRVELDGVEVTTIVSCWKMTKEELEEVVRTGRVWIMVYGAMHPPIAVEGIKPFEGEGNANVST